MEKIMNDPSEQNHPELPETAREKKVTRARQALMSALLDQLSMKSFEDISTKDICAQAQVHRSTLYKYYADKYDLLKESLTILFTNLGKKARSPETDSTYEIGEQIFEFVEKYHFLFEKILIVDHTGELRHMTQEILIDLVFRYNFEWPVAKSEDFWQQRNLCARYYTGALLSVVEWWLRDKMQPAVPLMAEYLRKLDPYPTLPYETIP